MLTKSPVPSAESVPYFDSPAISQSMVLSEPDLPLAMQTVAMQTLNGQAVNEQTVKLYTKDLSKRFTYQRQDLQVLDNINIALQANEFVCLVGASGCGKSTLLKIIAGLEKATTGKAVLGKAPILGPGADRGMVFQNYTLFPWRTVADNISYGLELKGLNRQQRKQQISYYLDVVGLSKFANAYPKQLSGGMKQRVAIARALANEPEVLLMDEPFSALDAQTKEQMQEFMHDLWERTHLTVLMVTHDVEEAIFLSQRIYVMAPHPGRIAAELTVELPEHRELSLKLEPNFIEIKRQVLTLLAH
jgi:ABC-type nitrate/sulfonate/bicarbonate transport system ATPase subunit